MEFILYRHFSASGELLYVGASLGVLQRTLGHAAKTSWFCNVTQITLERHGDKEELRVAEWAAIEKESPKYNLAGSPARRKKWPPFKAPIEVIPYDEWPKSEKEKFAKLTDFDKEQLHRKDRHVPKSLAWNYKLSLNTVYFLREGRHLL